jgi:hypothetical protein
MWRAFSTEVQGWREALTDRATVGALLRLLLFATLCAAGGAVGSGIAGPYAAVLGTVLAALGILLARLRATGRL